MKINTHVHISTSLSFEHRPVNTSLGSVIYGVDRIEFSISIRKLWNSIIHCFQCFRWSLLEMQSSQHLPQCRENKAPFFDVVKISKNFKWKLNNYIKIQVRGTSTPLTSLLKISTVSKRSLKLQSWLTLAISTNMVTSFMACLCNNVLSVSENITVSSFLHAPGYSVTNRWLAKE